MICTRDRYLNLNRILLLTVGLWPYKQTKLVRLQMILFYSILASFIILQTRCFFLMRLIQQNNFPQFTTFMTSECTAHLVIEVLSIAFVYIISLIKYNSFCFKMNIVKHLIELPQHTYDELKDEGEIAILEKYWNIARRYTEILTLFGICGMFSFILSPFLPRIFDIVWNKSLRVFANESRPHPSLQIFTEYFIDQERYFHLIMLHASAAFCIGEIALLATGTILIVYFQHICGMLRIASYRMEQAMRINIRQTNGMNLVYKGIAYAVDMHRKAMKFIKIFLSAFNVMMFSLMTIGLLAASLNLYRIFQEISSKCVVEKVIQSFMLLSVYYIYTFIANDVGQQLTDHNNHVFTTVYNTQWYIAPAHIQKLILFLLQRGTKDLKIELCGLFKGSLEGFTTLVSTSISYFTLLYSTNQ